MLSLARGSGISFKCVRYGPISIRTLFSTVILLWRLIATPLQCFMIEKPDLWRLPLRITHFARKWSIDHRLKTPGILAVIVIRSILTNEAFSESVLLVRAGDPLGVRFADQLRGSSKP